MLRILHSRAPSSCMVSKNSLYLASMPPVEAAFAAAAAAAAGGAAAGGAAAAVFGTGARPNPKLADVSAAAALGLGLGWGAPSRRTRTLAGTMEVTVLSFWARGRLMTVELPVTVALTSLCGRSACKGAIPVAEGGEKQLALCLDDILLEKSVNPATTNELRVYAQYVHSKTTKEHELNSTTARCKRHRVPCHKPRHITSYTKLYKFLNSAWMCCTTARCSAVECSSKSHRRLVFLVFMIRVLQIPGCIVACGMLGGGIMPWPIIMPGGIMGGGWRPSMPGGGGPGGGGRMEGLAPPEGTTQ